MNGVRHFLLALQFFTRVPVTGPLAGWVGFSPAMLRASAAHFPDTRNHNRAFEHNVPIWF